MTKMMMSIVLLHCVGEMLAPLTFAPWQDSEHEHLEKALSLARSEAASDRRAAARQLTFIKQKPAVDALVVLLKDPASSVRLEAVEGLGFQGAATTVVAIDQARQMETDERVRQRLTRVLERLRSSADYKLSCLSDADPKRRAQAARALEFGHDEDARIPDALVALLEDPIGEVRLAAANSLVTRRDARVIPFELNALESKDPVARLMAAEAVGKLRTSVAVKPLIRALDDPVFRSAAIEALGKIGDVEAVQPIVETLRGWSGDNNWVYAAQALSRMGDSALPRLVEALKSWTGKSDDISRMNVVRCLGLLGRKEAGSTLIASLTDPSSGVRRAAATALAALGEDAHVDPLLRALGDQDHHVNAAVVGALGRLRAPRAVGPLVSWLRKLSPLDEADAVLTALGEIGAPECVAPLIEVIQGTFTSAYVFQELDRYYAAKALATIGTATVESALFDALRKSDDSVILGAHRYFIAVGRDGSQESLIGALNRATVTKKSVAEAFLFSDDPKLVAAAKEWAAAKRQKLLTYVPHGVKWKQGLPRPTSR